MQEMQQIMEKLTQEAHRSSTRKNYLSVGWSFSKFYLHLDHKPMNWEQRIILFVGFLIQNKRKSTTIKSYISAIRTILKEDKIDISEDSFQLKALTRACKLMVDKVKTHLPIHKDVLCMIIKQVKCHFKDQPYLSLLYWTIFVTGYFGLFRIGELTASDHTVKAVDE